MVTALRKRVDDLLLARATEGLSPAETQELDRLLAANPDVDSGVYDHAAAAVCLAVLAGNSMPSGLRARLEKSAVELAATTLPPNTNR